MKRQVQETTEEEKEFLHFQEKQKQIQRLRALNLHLPFSVYTEGQGLSDEDLGYVVNHVKGDWKHPVPPPRTKRVSVIKGVLEARDPHDSPGVESMRQKLLEDFAGTVFQDRTGGNPPIRGPHGEAVIILKPGAVPIKQRMFQIHGERKVAWGKLVDQIIDDDKMEPGVSPWNSPSFPVPKKKPNDYRLVEDFRKVNDNTEDDAHPLP